MSTPQEKLLQHFSLATPVGCISSESTASTMQVYRAIIHFLIISLDYRLKIAAKIPNFHQSLLYLCSKLILTSKTRYGKD
ncbi:hypothetical protein IQ278_29185 [Tolypothrix sp. LEGE 11397]|nr:MULTISPECIES: hypothetical protein [unclassified Tolypothrix]MBE9086124.1 hypothetical protein [Tolypothrix sp. LEGE 11397]UYD29290.1 hypothetical protein HGR01_15355 [Tolypothrix sp. PCC 7712]